MKRYVPRRRQQFIEALQDFIRTFEDLETAEISEALEQVSKTLVEHGGDEASYALVEDGARWRLVCHYPTARALERDLVNLLAVRGLVVKTDRRPTVMQALEVVIRSATSDEEVVLGGRVVQRLEGAIAVEILRPGEDATARLRLLATPQPSAPGPVRSTWNGLPHTKRIVLPPEFGDEPAPHDPDASTPDEEEEEEEKRTPAASRREHATPPEARPAPGQAAGQVIPCAPLIDVGQAATARWQLDQIGLDRVLCAVAERSGCGVLQVESGPYIRQILCHDDRLLDVQTYPAPEAETLEHLLCESGHIDHAQLERARAYAATHEVSVADALVRMGILPADRVQLSYKARVLYLLDRLATRCEGVARYFALESLPRRYFHPPVCIRSRVLTWALARYERMPHDELLAACERYEERTIAVRNPRPANLDLLEIDAPTRALLAAIGERPRTLRDLLGLDAAPQSATLARVLALDYVNLLQLDANTDRTRAHEKLARAIEALYLRLSTDDYFTLLGVHWSTYEQELQRAYHTICERFSPAAVAHLDDASRSRAACIMDCIDKAYDALRNPVRRDAYRRSLIDDYAIDNAIKMYRHQAETAKLRRDLDEAIDACCRVVELDPDDQRARDDLKFLRPLKLRDRLNRRS